MVVRRRNSVSVLKELTDIIVIITVGGDELFIDIWIQGIMKTGSLVQGLLIARYLK